MAYPTKSTPLDAPVSKLIEQRWSPLAFNDKELSAEDIASLFEAARWAPSAFNEQPWRYVYAQKNDTNRAAIESLLMDGNSWAKNAGLLIVSFAKPTFTYNGKENKHALHDLGCASGYLVLEATARGLASHQMSGFFADKANEALGVPKEFIPGSMIAIGFPGDAGTLSPELEKREDAPRSRNAAKTFAFPNMWKQ